jgi:membrane protease YdiL (CAAX protease family)
LPFVSRERVLGSCAASAGAMVAAALGLRWLAAHQSAALFGTSQEAIDALLQLRLGAAGAQQAAVLLGAAGAVTAGRLALLAAWPAFAASSERSNQQVLGPLGLGDAALVALLSGVSEELLFRGGLVPAIAPDVRGVLVAGAVFGALHVNGGRGLAYAAWASLVGCVYGAALLATGSVWVPAGAHALANFTSAALWIGGRGVRAAAAAAQEEEQQ